MSSQQGVMSPATIAGRTQIVKKNYEWLLKLENAYLDVYAEFQKAYTKIYAPYKPLYNEFNVAYADFPLNKLSPETAATFIKLCDQMNSTLFFLGDKAAMINLQVNFMIMMYSESIGPAYALKTSFTMSMQSLFMYVAIRSYDRPIAEACITKMLSGYVPAYEPMAQSFLQMGYDITATIPALKSNASFAINCAVADGRALSKKMKSCGKNSLTNECTDQIVSEFLHFCIIINKFKIFTGSAICNWL